MHLRSEPLFGSPPEPAISVIRHGDVHVASASQAALILKISRSRDFTGAENVEMASHLEDFCGFC